MRKNNNSFQVQVSPDEIKSRIRSYWDKWSADYDKFHGSEEEEAWKRFFYEKFGGEKQRILDVGTGTGFLSLPLAELGHDVLGVDITEGMLSVCGKNAKERGLNIDLRIGDAESLDFEDESFDAVVSRWVLWTLPNPEKAICEWMRVLKPGRGAYAFGSVWSGEKGGIGSRIKRNLGLFMITVVERKNAWNWDYDDEIKKKLPLHYEKSDSNVQKIEFFRKCGFEEVTTTIMEEVNMVRRREQTRMPLRYKLAWGSNSDNEFCCLSGSKLEGRRNGIDEQIKKNLGGE